MLTVTTSFLLLLRYACGATQTDCVQQTQPFETEKEGLQTALDSLCHNEDHMYKMNMLISKLMSHVL